MLYAWIFFCVASSIMFSSTFCSSRLCKQAVCRTFPCAAMQRWLSLRSTPWWSDDSCERRGSVTWRCWLGLVNAAVSAIWVEQQDSVTVGCSASFCTHLPPICQTFISEQHSYRVFFLTVFITQPSIDWLNRYHPTNHLSLYLLFSAAEFSTSFSCLLRFSFVPFYSEVS